MGNKGPILIAHAGGALEGATDLNSKEAVENAIQNGFLYIELDLLETADGDIVAAHDWPHFHQLTGNTGSERILNASEAKLRKILGAQTVLISKDIHEIFMSHPSIYLVTDKIQNIDLLYEKFSDFKDRIIVEVFSVEKYREVQSRGFLHAAFCVWNNDFLHQKVNENQIDMITLSAVDIYNSIKWHKTHPNVVSFAFSPVDGIANDKEVIKKVFPYITGWYTDYLTPKMLKADSDV